MNEALANMCKHTSMGVVEAVNAVTKLPAQQLGIKKGELNIGYDADIVIFDEVFSVREVFIGGNKQVIL